MKAKLPDNPTPTMRALNPHLWPEGQHSPECQCAACLKPANVAPAPTKGTGKGKPRGRAAMNKTETAYSQILEAMKSRGEIKRWEREGITLRWPDGMTYSPDFAVWELATDPFPEDHTRERLVFIEVKGPFIREDALVKFRAARAHWPEFAFSMMQLKKGEWTQIL